MGSSDFVEVIRSRISKLRPRLLDLSRRNPLIKTNLSQRSASVIRIVDEVPAQLLSSLLAQRAMRFAPLPRLENDPKDELSEKFQTALSDARRTNEAYLVASKAIDHASESALEKNRQIDRELRDRVREALGMPLRVTAHDVSLTQHAKNNGISPSYDLPAAADTRDSRHADTDIQTLFLPEDLERKLNSLVNKCTTWQQETGINVLHAAIGFVEWTEPSGGEIAFAPLLLTEVQIEKTKTAHGPEFWVSLSGEEMQSNLVFAEKLRVEFGVALPPYAQEPLEEYFSRVEAAAPPNLGWRVRRQVAFGVFPSARLAMYHDLDTNKHDFAANEVVASLFGGTTATDATPFADEYEVDKPEIEALVPRIVLDADSSQYSTLVDVARGTNLAVEGPPGTGKSQTIVNAIAAAIAAGKKVLFVAEKTAALEVVKSRLEAIGLGPYVLPLQAERANRRHVAVSLKDRLEMDPGRGPADYDRRVERFQGLRSDLAEYISVISKQFGRSDLTVYQVIGKSLIGNDVLAAMPRALQRPAIPEIELYDRTRIEAVLNAAAALEKGWRDKRAAFPFWAGITIVELDRFKIDNLLESANGAAIASETLLRSRKALERHGLPSSLDLAALEAISKLQGHVAAALSNVDRQLVASLCCNPNLGAAKKILQASDRVQRKLAALETEVKDPLDPDVSRKLQDLAEIANRLGVDTVDLDQWNDSIESGAAATQKRKLLCVQLAPLLKSAPQLGRTPARTLRAAALVVQRFGIAVLTLRTEANADLTVRKLLKQGCASVQALALKHQKLVTVFTMVPDSPPSELLDHSRVIRGATFLGRFGKSFQSAKRVYRAHASLKFEASRAADDLQRAAEFRISESEIEADNTLREIFGPTFRGYQTDVRDFLKLYEFYEEVGGTFAGLQNQQIRQFLLSGPLDALLALADVPDGGDATFDDLHAEIAQGEERQKSFRDALLSAAPLAAVVRNPRSITGSGLLEIADTTRKVQRSAASLDASQQAASLFGQRWLGWKTDTADLTAAVELAVTICGQPAFSDRFITWIGGSSIEDAQGTINEVITAVFELAVASRKLGSETGVDPANLVHSDPSVALDAFKAMAADRDGLIAHSRYHSCRAELSKYGFGWIETALQEVGHSLENLSAKVEAVIYRAMAIKVFETYGSIISKHGGASLDGKRAQLAQLDREIIQASQLYVRKQVFDGAKPPPGIGTGPKSAWTELSLIKNEANKQQSHISLRELNRRAGNALKQLKPCWMMSPLAVAQYLPPGRITFDLCIIDEASQMPPEDAIGAISRCKQVMIVGDTNQLPPSSFFRAMFDDDDVQEDEAVLEESILELANGTFRPARRLRWHYRSRHPSLIQFSNEHVYGGNLIVFPAASDHNSKRGVRLERIEGLYRSSVNPAEASAMVEAAISFMRDNPDRSLGMVTMNQKQRELIQEEWDAAVARTPHAASYIENWLAKNDGLERFFIKNLENVQGDERDVIFIGTVYGPEAPGRPVMQRFGPINGVAGRRRLNVLFSRAKEQIVTFSSMTASDIVADENGNVGAYMLRQWLEYAATGVIHGGQTHAGQPDSDFEIFVMEQLKAMGCTPVPQVGVKGYSIDIGVKHPAWPHGYILAVECDGASYHSSKSARDRDRLRQQVLEGLGWKFHRIWSTDWFNDPRKEAIKMRHVVAARLEELGVEGVLVTP